MVKNIVIAALIAASAFGATVANAGEGSFSAGHGIKCTFVGFGMIVCK
jgi:hypothetical protein